MRIRETLWTAGILEKVQAKHGLTQEEVDYVCLGHESHLRRARNGRHIVLGRSEAGRYLFVAGAYLGQGALQIITARDMTVSERALYQRHAP